MTMSPSTRFSGNATGLPIALCGTATTMDGADAGPASVPAAAASPDALLFSLGRAWTAMVQRCAEIDASAESTAAERGVARALKAVLGSRIAAKPAQTLEGIDVKALLSGAAFDA